MSWHIGWCIGVPLKVDACFEQVSLESCDIDCIVAEVSIEADCGEDTKL